MTLPMLAVDSNNEFSQREQAAWMAQGIATVLTTATTADASAPYLVRGIRVF